MARDRRTLGQLFGVGIPRTETIGVRITMIVEGDTLPAVHGGVQSVNASVTINALASDTMEDALAHAVEFANGGNLGARGGLAREVTVLEAEISQLFFGGYSNPTINRGR